MSKIKNNLINGLTQEELEYVLYNRYIDDSDYQRWLESDEYVNFVNGKLTTLKPIYSEFDLGSSVRYASAQIQIEPSEVGKEVYDKLFIEKIYEYLNLYTNGF